MVAIQPIIIHDFDQRSAEWRAARLGRLTGSRADDMLKTVQKGEAAGRKKLRIQLALERLTGRSQEKDYVSAAMQHGIDTEAEARGIYEALTGTLLQQTGFIQHAELMAGCSLDGHAGGFASIVEIKAPEPHTHLEYIRTGVVPLEYARQVQHALWLTGAAYCDWMSYHPEFPEGLRAKIVLIKRNDADIADYDRAARLFLKEVDALMVEVQAMQQKAQAA